ncbi:MAG: hypothetical protein IJG65_05960 [Synergistaceae bacterium]|nr:hypothetical protein [Synergistaceae bacterium]
MSICAVVLVKYLKKHSINGKSAQNVEIISSLRLTAGDIFFVVHCGPDVIAFVSGSHGTCLMGRWSYEKWTETLS